MIKELAAACLANMLCGMEEVSTAVVRLGADRVLRAFLNSPTAAVQVGAAWPCENGALLLPAP